MATTNQQAQDLLEEFKAINRKAKDYLDDVKRIIAEIDLKYAQSLVQNDINMMKAAKTILENKK
jgi:KaiC/GvpD/RAD55 family RecA-like ATPase